MLRPIWQDIRLFVIATLVIIIPIGFLFMQSVAYPCLEPLILRLVNFFEARKATDYLEKSADMIIEARKMESNDSAKVSMYNL